jgi:hypothetical protein
MQIPSPSDTFAKFMQRPKYHTLNVENIKSAPDDDIDQMIMDAIELKLARYEHNVAKMISTLSSGCRYLYLTWVVGGEVNNGGFHQLYWNGYGNVADEAVEAFEYFSAPAHADLMREANRIRAREKFKLAPLRLLNAYSLSAKWSWLDPLDDQFYDLNEDLAALRLAKIRANPEQFVVR